MFDLKCDPSTCACPIDDRVVAELSQRYPLDPVYLACLKNCHGGQPQIGTVQVAGRTYRVAFFLTLVDHKTELPGPFRPHFDQHDIDERVANSVTALMDCECNTSRCLFDNLVPFASTQTDMCLDRGYVDLFCFDYRNNLSTPAVVLWDSNNAMDAYFDWDKLPFEEKFDENENCNFLTVPWDTFLVHVAYSFADFVKMLKPNPEQMR
jgi:hypothetical protein